jgi:hypothetical protein
MRINRLKPVTWHVEENTGGREGIGAGPRSGVYSSEAEAVAQMIAAKAAGHGATCIARNRKNAGVALVLGLVKS